MESHHCKITDSNYYRGKGINMNRGNEEVAQKIIDTKLPLTWLLSSAAAIIMTMALIAINFNRQSDSLNSKMDAVLASNAEMKAQSKERDVKHDALRESLYSTQRMVDAHDLRLNALERGYSGRR